MERDKGDLLLMISELRGLLQNEEKDNKRKDILIDELLSCMRDLERENKQLKGEVSMVKYRKKPVVVEVFRFIGDDELIDKLIEFAGSHNLKIDPITEEVFIKTLEGDMHVSYGDYIIRGVHQELYPCKPDIFDKTYELVSE